MIFNIACLWFFLGVQTQEVQIDLPKLEEYTATAYDLSYESCEKRPGDYWYGKTYNGTNLVGKSREEAMTIAADRRLLPIGSKVYIHTKEERYRGIYTVNDIGGAIKNRRIDIFIPNRKEALRFGRQKIKIIKVK